MKDTELQRRLFELGMGHEQAARVTAQIRDRLHPAAVVAVYHMDGLAGLDGNIFKKIGGGVRHLMKQSLHIGGKIGKVASFIPGPIGAAAGAAGAVAGGVDKKLRYKAAKKLVAKANAGDPKAMAKVAKMQQKAIAQSIKQQAKEDKKEAKLLAKADKAGFTFDASGDAKSDKRNFKAAKKGAKNASKALAAGGTVPVAPGTIADAASIAMMTPPGGDVSDAMGAALSSGGMNFNSPAAQGLLDDVAAEGVEQTAGGPLPEWVKPVGLGIAVLGAAYLFAKKRR